MFNHQAFEDRLSSWVQFRNLLESSTNPLKDLISWYGQAEWTKVDVNPWHAESWPTPWDLIYFNQYNYFCVVLGMSYSLKLTERFKNSHIEIHITRDVEKQAYKFFLAVDDVVLCIATKSIFKKDKLLKTACTIKKYLPNNFS